MDRTDFNDLHVLEGLPEVKKQLVAALREWHAANDSDIESALTTSPSPSGDDAQPAQRVTLTEMLRRFALIEGKTNVWDYDERQVVKKMALIDLVGKPCYNEWTTNERRRTVSPKDVATMQSQGSEGENKLLDRFIYIYPTRDVWDSDIQQIVPLDVLKAAIPSEFDFWNKSPQRKSIRQEKIVFDPTQTVDPATHINRFTGFEIKRDPNHAKCVGILLLLESLCGNRPEVLEWITRWLAYPLQHVGAKMDTALLVHSSQQGSGKSMLFADICCQIYGRYGTVLGQHQLESQYTEWRSEKLFGTFEEVLSRDQKYSHMGTVKHMISGKTQRIEKKFVSGWEESNHLNAIFLSNEFQPFPIEASDRRFLVVWPEKELSVELQVQAGKEIENGGLEAFYDFLLTYPLGDFDQRTKPIMTKEKERLINFGLSSHECFYIEWRRGDLGIPFESCVIADLYKVYAGWCQDGNERALSRRKFTEIFSVMPDLRRQQCRFSAGHSSEKQWVFIVGSPPADITLLQWLGDSIEKFRKSAFSGEEY